MADRADTRYKPPAAKGPDGMDTSSAKAEIKKGDDKSKGEAKASTTPEEQMTSTPMSGGAEDVAAIAERHAKERAQTYDRHNRERSQMSGRHDKDFKDLYSRHAEEMTPKKKES